MGFFTKPKIEFLCMLPEALAAHPVQHISKARPKWLDEHATDYAFRSKETLTDENVTLRTVAKCRGIREMFRTGWLLYNWQDIYIRVEEGGKFTWSTPVSQKQLIGFDMVSFHSNESFSKCPHLAEQVPIIKVLTPWRAKIPDGYSLMQLGVPYQEHDMFTTGTGIFPDKFGFMELNIQLFWHEKRPMILKAGTPLAHLVLIKNEEISSEIRLADEKERRLIAAQQTIKNSMFRPNYVDMVDSIRKVGGA